MSLHHIGPIILMMIKIIQKYCITFRVLAKPTALDGMQSKTEDMIKTFAITFRKQLKITTIITEKNSSITLRQKNHN